MNMKTILINCVNEQPENQKYATSEQQTHQLFPTVINKSKYLQINMGHDGLLELKVAFY